MIAVAGPAKRNDAVRLVAAALARSVTAAAVRTGDVEAALEDGTFVCLVDAPDAWGARLARWLESAPRKALLFGHMPAALARALGAAAPEPCGLDPALARAAPAEPGRPSESALSIVYRDTAPATVGTRALERFDFAEEWNNLGYGAVRLDGGIWALADAWQAPDDAELARLQHRDGASCGSYAALFELGASAVLWVNRPVGPIDSVEWRLVEAFLSCHGADALPCLPVLREVPHGHDAAVTMRLDCDEDLASAAGLFDAYRELDVPFSLAVHTAILMDERHHPLMRQVMAEGGAVLSHSATHAPNWGGSVDAAAGEAERSADAIEAVLGARPRHAVSPFHQTPHYALEALAARGYRGCIGGIISADPDFLMARGGAVDGLPETFVGHSQQCMLHGDCMAREGDPLAAYKHAFDLARDGGTLFGYLDHPFSERYWYGWPDEETRIDAHRAFVAHMRETAKSPLFLNEDEALDVLRAKAATRLRVDGTAVAVEPGGDLPRGLRLAVDYRGETVPS